MRGHVAPNRSHRGQRRWRAGAWCAGVVCAGVVCALVLVATPTAHAGPSGKVALLPLDADQQLELYGQPVASEIARALVAGGVDVVVVGPRMAVPQTARLIVDGTIANGKDDAVVLSIRVRNADDGVVVATMQSQADTLATIDRAAAELSSRVLPAVQARLTAMSPRPAVKEPRGPNSPAPAPKLRPMLLAISASSATADRLRGALTEAVEGWARAHHRTPTPTEPAKLSGKLAASTVKGSGNDLAVAFEIAGYQLEPGKVPLARARVRVRISDAVGVVFDRVLVTDTVVGDRGMADDALARRVAAEVVDIVRPNIKRTVIGWR